MTYAEEIKWDLDFCKRLDADQDQLKHQKHAESCKEIVEQIVDLATKVGEYRLLSEKYVTVCRFVKCNYNPNFALTTICSSLQGHLNQALLMFKRKFVRLL